MLKKSEINFIQSSYKIAGNKFKEWITKPVMSIEETAQVWYGLEEFVWLVCAYYPKWSTHSLQAL